ncbi:MAG: hypothetical protein A3E78_13970 [Alphaproteobacteria bacterium RIFCSPHIGHO2_12_FULL_63_12]|nr:MAG: hypothetical protein A3E78_13970 [Alphaproteobacteria bacterium RIFCSPHIGHO2_12_FULL_63_12]
MTANLTWLCEVRDASMLDGALIYAAHGWAVFPLRGKLPPPGFVGGFHNATTDAAQIRQWWAQWPNANIGWPIPAGWFAIDEDPRHAGNLSRAIAERVYGILPSTLRQITGGGGYQWFLKSSVAIQQRAAWMDGIDTRTVGRGYVVVAPSIHPVTGQRYEWHTVAEPLDAPAWVVDMMRVRESKRVPYIPPARVDARHLGRRERYGRAVVAGIARRVAAAIEGERNDLLNWAWWKALEWRDVVPEGEARTELTRAALTCGLGESEIAKVLR